MLTYPIIALDGHDGVGKTTLAKRLAETNCGIYVRPFGGSTGIKLIQAAEAKSYEKVIEIGKNAIEKETESEHAKPLIFDRHWITVLSLLPKQYWKCWPKPVHTFLCSADLETIKSRIAPRKEKKFDDNYHSHYLHTYIQIAKECNCVVIDTDQLSITQACKNIESLIGLKKIEPSEK